MPNKLYSGSCDGTVILWNLTQTEKKKKWKAHNGFCRGLVESVDGKFLFTVGDDKCIKQWNLYNDKNIQDSNSCITGSSTFSGGSKSIFNNNELKDIKIDPINTFKSPSLFTSIDHHWRKPLLITTGETVDLWDYNRSQPINSFEWGCDLVLSCKFNPAESCLLGATASDNSISLYDLRSSTGIRKVILSNRSNSICWNPQEPQYFTVANENTNLYTFDMRKLTQAIHVHSDHVMPVLDIDYSPNGQQFCTASYDKSIRIFDKDGTRAKQTYHTKRMQRVLACQFSSDGRFVFSGSEDHNVRIWKTNPSEKLGILSEREKKATLYRDKLKEKFGTIKEIHRIARHTHLPKPLLSQEKKIREMKNAQTRKFRNVRTHSKKGTTQHVSVKSRMVNEEVQ